MGRPNKHKKPITLAFVPRHIELASQSVDNPDWRPEREGEKAFPRKVAMAVNIRECSIATLAHKEQIDAAQAAAADKFRRLFEAAGGSGAPAMDMTKDVVDGGKGPEDIKDSVVNAMFELVEARKVLGLDLYELVRAVAGERRSIHDLFNTRRQRDTALDMLRIGLTRLAELWNFAEKQRARHRNDPRAA